MRELRKSGSVGARGGKPPWATRLPCVPLSRAVTLAIQAVTLAIHASTLIVALARRPEA